MNEHQKFITDELDKPKVQWLSMSAKFAGTCIECNGAIDRGESILWNKKNGAKHKDCPVMNNDNSITVLDDNRPTTWRDSKKYSYSTLQGMNECQCCGVDVSDRSKRYIDDDRLVCVNCFG